MTRRLTPRRALLTGALLALPLSAPAVASAQLGDETLRKGDSGADVKELQRALDKAGYPTTADGKFGAQTLKRVRAFEAAEDLRVDGKVTPADARKLESVAQQEDDGGATPDGTPPEEGEPAPTTPGPKATLGPDQLAVAPAGAPEQVKKAIAAGNEIAKSPYKYGGGHGKLKDSGYDCSGSISYALRKAGLMKTSMPSGPMMKFGEKGPGQWITIYAKPSHAYVMIAGLRFDTSARKREGSRWSKKPVSGEGGGYAIRHPEGF